MFSIFHKFQIYNWRYIRPIVAPIAAPIHIKHVHSSVSYRWEIYQKYDRRGHESPNGCEHLGLLQQ